MGVPIYVAAIVCFLGIIVWLLTKAREQGEAFSLIPAYLNQHGIVVLLSVLVVAAQFIWDVIYGPQPIEPSRLVTIFFMAMGAISFLDHGKGGST